jgi:organic radical activating enzyme
MITDNWSVEDIESQCADGIPLIVFGAGRNAAIFMYASPLAGLVRCIVDNNPTLWGTTKIFDSKPYTIHAPEDVLSKHECMSIIVTPNDCASIETQLEDTNAYVYSLTRRRKYDEFSKKSEIDLNAKLGMDLMRLDVRCDIDSYFANEFKTRAELFKSPDNIVIPQVVFILSNKCSLKCEHCSMLMPRFRKPWELPVDEAIKYIDNFLRGTDEVLTFNLIGGEPLLYNDLPALINHLHKYDKVKRVSLSTNCTIIPNDEILSALSLSKVEVLISDYGDLVQMAKTIQNFERNNVNMYLYSNQQWLDFGGTQYRSKDPVTLKEAFSRCFVASYCKAVYKEKFFVCERAARMFMLGDVYEASHDYVSLDLNANDNEIRLAIRELQALDFANACNYCDAGNLETKKIPAGKQIGQQADEMSGYTIVKRGGCG